MNLNELKRLLSFGLKVFFHFGQICITLIVLFRVCNTLKERGIIRLWKKYPKRLSNKILKIMEEIICNGGNMESRPWED